MSSHEDSAPITNSTERKRMVEAIANGTVIDHIPGDRTLQVAALLAGPADQVFIGQNLRSARLGRKGVVKISGRSLSQRQLQALALIAPTASVSVIVDYCIGSKAPVQIPDRFEGLAKCANPNCVTNHERWTTVFSLVERVPLRVRCVYCERVFPSSDLVALPT